MQERKRWQVNDCIDCGRPIGYYSTRCIPCQGRAAATVEKRECPRCGDTFEVLPSSPKRHCSRACGNFRGTGVTCPDCGHYSIRRHTPTCVKCRAEARAAARESTPPKPRSNPTWTPDRVAYLVAHFPHEGAAAVGAALGVSASAAESKAHKLGLRLTSERMHRVRAEVGRRQSGSNNPAFQPEARAKIRAWRVENPERAVVATAKMIRTRARKDRTQPSGLEHQLREHLANLGVEFEASVAIKPRFIVDIRIGRLIIEADGDYWHGHPRLEPLSERQRRQRSRDRSRDGYLRACGYTIARIWESDMSLEAVREVLAVYEEARNTQPPLAGAA